MPAEGAKSTLRAVLARALAEALIGGIDQAEAEGRPLNQLQRIHLATMAIMAYEEGRRDGEAALEVDARLEAHRQGARGGRA